MAEGMAFTSHDGPDEEGVRAEVWVQKGTAEVKDVDIHENKKVASIKLKAEGLKFPQFAWINVDTPEFAMVQKAYDERGKIEYRIESQRKLKDSDKNPISRRTPIAELREDKEKANKTIRNILVGVNGSRTNEAVTHPDEDDSKSSSRHVAQAPSARQPNTAEAAPAQNNNSRQQYNNGGNPNVTEEPPFKELNSDGTTNLGSYSVQAAVGAELFVRRSLVATRGEDGYSEDDVFMFGAILLAISDKIQAYVTKKNANRMAPSHTRVRSFVYDVVEHFIPIPENDHETIDAWVKAVGKLTLARFNTSMRLVTTPFDLNTLKPVADNSQAPANNNVQRPNNTRNQAPNRAEAPSRPQAEAPTQESAPEQDVTHVQNSANPLAGAKAFEIFPPVAVNAVTEENKMDEETLEQFKEFVGEVVGDDPKAGYAKVAKLIKHTFNVDKASKVPGAPFEEFLDFYIGHGPENFEEVLEYVDTIKVD